MTLADIAKLTDVFYIGGTKCGALCGEAVVFTHGNMPKQFVTMVKRRGAMIAKGRLNALQFDALFTDGLYEKICAPAVKLAIKLRDGSKQRIPLCTGIPDKPAVHHCRNSRTARAAKRR